MGEYLAKFPSQKKSIRQKTKQWRKSNIDSVENSGFLTSEYIRATLHNRNINQNLYNGILDQTDIERVCNPNEIRGLSTDRELQHYPLAVPRIDVLLGEEAKRRFDYRAVVTNPNAISAKEEEKKNFIRERLKAFIESTYTEAQLEEKLAEFEEEVNYKWQDLREIMANRILRHYYVEHRMPHLFNEAFRDLLILGEEIVQCDIVDGEPTVRKLVPQNVYSLRSGYSNRIEDSDVIVIDEYWSPGKIIDTFYKELKSSEVTKLERGFFNAPGNDPFTNDTTPEWPTGTFIETGEDGGTLVDGMANMMIANGATFNRPYDMNGNIRVLQVYWRSF